MNDRKSTQPRVMRVSGETVTALAWIGPMLMLLAEAIGSGEILTEPVAGARYGGALLWLILLTIVTKAFWNEAIGPGLPSSPARTSWRPAPEWDRPFPGCPGSGSAST